jgi:hypothetical protein
MLGNFLFWGGIVYGLSKFVNGIVGDRVGPRKMLCLGLLACTMVNVAFGFAPQIAAMLGNGERECCFSLDVRTASRPQSVLPGDWFPAVCEADRVLDTAGRAPRRICRARGETRVLDGQKPDSAVGFQEGEESREMKWYNMDG